VAVEETMRDEGIFKEGVFNTLALEFIYASIDDSLTGEGIS
jgi:hypothetical protein